jgi:predicted RecB family nuclease
MKGSNSITAAIFSAFLRCPTKAHLLAIGESAPSNYFANIQARTSSTYKIMATRRLRDKTDFAGPLDFGQLSRNSNCAPITHDVDCETAVYDLPLAQRGPVRRRSWETSQRGGFVPVLFLPWDKPSLSDSLLVCFGALALSQATGSVSGTGTLICGDGYRQRTVKIGNYVARTHQIISEIGGNWEDRKLPPLVLNRHCAVCDFQPRCRGLAIERDDLSLLTAMTSKERAKFNAKGISTITQLSYGYRPRRRKRTTNADALHSAKSSRRTAPVVKNDHKLKALAIKKNQIHVVGAPPAKFTGIPVFLDVEGMPDRNFYYLVGLRYACGGEQVERSFWSDGLDGERSMWDSCLRELREIGDAQVVSYGHTKADF